MSVGETSDMPLTPTDFTKAPCTSFHCVPFRCWNSGAVSALPPAAAQTFDDDRATIASGAIPDSGQAEPVHLLPVHLWISAELAVAPPR